MNGHAFRRRGASAFPRAPYLVLPRFLDLLCVRQLFSCVYKQQIPRDNEALLAFYEIQRRLMNIPIKIGNVILSAAKNLPRQAEILRGAQNDRRLPILIVNIHQERDKSRPPYLTLSVQYLS
jgi:hypothetical protein